MAAVNQAWFVLSDPGPAGHLRRLAAGPARPARRRRRRGRPQGAGDLDDAEGFVPIRHPAARFGIPLPWLVVLAALAVIFVFTAYAVRPKGAAAAAGRPDGVLEVGSCVTVAAVGAVVETGCDAPHEGRVVAIPSSGHVLRRRGRGLRRRRAPGGWSASAGGSRRGVC